MTILWQNMINVWWFSPTSNLLCFTLTIPKMVVVTHKRAKKKIYLRIYLLLWVEKEQRSWLISFFGLWCTKKLNVWSNPTTITKLQKAPIKDWNPWTHPKVLIAKCIKKPTIRIRSKALTRGKTLTLNAIEI
jgi:hypothetical protein